MIFSRASENLVVVGWGVAGAGVAEGAVPGATGESGWIGAASLSLFFKPARELMLWWSVLRGREGFWS